MSPVSESSETRNNNNNEGGVVNFPGVNSGALTRDEQKVCIDSDGNKRLVRIQSSDIRDFLNIFN